MGKILLKRFYDADCVIGRLALDDLQCFTLELPDLENQKNISCIPEGTYNYFFRESPKNGRILQLEDVPDRAFIQIHAGNYTRQIEGCILVGEGIKFIDSDHIPDVFNSRAYLNRLLDRAGDRGTIEIYS